MSLVYETSPIISSCLGQRIGNVKTHGAMQQFLDVFGLNVGGKHLNQHESSSWLLISTSQFPNLKNSNGFFWERDPYSYTLFYLRTQTLPALFSRR